MDNGKWKMENGQWEMDNGDASASVMGQER